MDDSRLASGMMENLVTQFASPLDCFRELVQNSIDAGSPRVDVWIEFIAGEADNDGVGTIAVHVDDMGEGMDEAIIDNQLTRLFSSNKENDLTKIGKFGIGFVSIFALLPRAVLIHTGRVGEYWELLFNQDRSYTKTRIDTPTEGTQLTLFLSGDRHRYNELAQRIPETLRKWCSHSETEIVFEDASQQSQTVINEPFEVDGDCLTHVASESGDIAVAYTESPLYGFYNRGLTLALSTIGEQVFSVERAQRLSHISVKIKSRYLEHTLSRDTVVRDANYEKAMKHLDMAVNEQLFEQLVNEIEQLVARPGWGLGDFDRYGVLMSYLNHEPAELLEALEERPIFRDVHEMSVTPQTLYEAYRSDGRLLIAPESTALTREVNKQGVPVVLGQTGGTRRGLWAVEQLVTRYVSMLYRDTLLGQVKSLLRRPIDEPIRNSVCDPDDVFIAVEIDPEIPGEIAGMLKETRALLREVDTGFRQVASCRPGPEQSDTPLFVVGRKLSRLMTRPPDEIADRDLAEAAVNREHPHFKRLAELYPSRPALATYCLARSFLLQQDRWLDCDTRLMLAARAMGAKR